MATPESRLSPDFVAAQAAKTIALQMLEERGRGAVLVGARCQLRRRARCLANFVTRLIVTFALAPLSC